MEWERITSRQNRLVREAAALLRGTEQRRERRQFLCEGARLCQDAARSGVRVERCFFTEEAREKYGAYLAPVLAACGEAYRTEDHVMQLLSSTKHSQGIVCQCRWPETLGKPEGSFQGERSCAVLENLQDPGNLGTILRTAEALGVGEVFLLGECCDPLSPKAVRASMGAVFRVRLYPVASRERLADLFRKKGYILLAAVPGGDARPVTQVDFFRGRFGVFIGNEGNGLTEETIALCGGRVTIPMAGRAESLNASAAATILLWEMTRGAGKEEAHG